MDAPADICIEVVSPESTSLDYGEKFAAYEEGGVREYWLIDPVREQCIFHRINYEGLYVVDKIWPEGRYESDLLPGFVIEVGMLWKDKLPNVFSILEQIKTSLD